MTPTKRAASRKPCKKQAQDLDEQGSSEHSDLVSNNYLNSSVNSYFSSILKTSSNSNTSKTSTNKDKLLAQTTFKDNQPPPREAQNPYRRPQKNVIISNRVRNILRNDDARPKFILKSTCSFTNSHSTNDSSSASLYTCSLSSKGSQRKSKMKLRNQTVPTSISFPPQGDNPESSASSSFPNYHKRTKFKVFSSSSSENNTTHTERNLSPPHPSPMTFNTGTIREILKKNLSHSPHPVYHQKHSTGFPLF